MSDDSTSDVPDDVDVADADADNLPTVSCTRCGREWDLAYELDELAAGNQALEQFALDHQRHTGHFPDGAATWVATCRNCPEGVERLSQRATRRWAERHARHTRHRIDVSHGDGDAAVVAPGDWRDSAADEE